MQPGLGWVLTQPDVIGASPILVRLEGEHSQDELMGRLKGKSSSCWFGSATARQQPFSSPFLYLDPAPPPTPPPLGLFPTVTAFCPTGLTYYVTSSDMWHIINHVIIKCHLVILLLRTSAPLKFHWVTDTLERWACPAWLRGGGGRLKLDWDHFFCTPLGIIRKMLFSKRQVFSA